MSNKQHNIIADDDNEMLEDYDFSDAEEVSFQDRAKEGISITIYAPDRKAFEESLPNAKKFVLLDPDNAKLFPDAYTVNAALRSYTASQ
jgi:hypothetical protein